MRKGILYINSTLNGVVTSDPETDKTNFQLVDVKSLEDGSLLVTYTPVETCQASHTMHWYTQPQDLERLARARGLHLEAFRPADEFAAEVLRRWA
jgi:hypothetical protein